MNNSILVIGHEAEALRLAFQTLSRELQHCFEDLFIDLRRIDTRPTLPDPALMEDLYRQLVQAEKQVDRAVAKGIPWYSHPNPKHLPQCKSKQTALFANSKTLKLRSVGNLKAFPSARSNTLKN
ncbi:MAG: hypothetical protein U0X91_20630 [Spirosomataceae bacterium]